MMIEQHYDEEVLAEFLGEPNDTVARDKHLASCTLCRKTLDSLRTTAQTLTEPAVWDRTQVSTAPRPETLAFLRGMQKTMLDEDAQAALWIKALLAGPREAWAPRLAEHPEWRTGGMVRRLLKETESAINTLPADAVVMGGLGVDIAETLDTSNARHLQGLAHHCHAYALWYVGAISESLEELDLAEDRLNSVFTAEFDRGRSQLLRSMFYETLERRNEALSLASSAALIFRSYHDSDRFAAAKAASAVALQSVGRLREAVAIHSEIISSEQVSESWRLSALHNMALCYCELGEFDQAAECLLRAIAGYERLSMLTFRSRSRWALADIFTRRGDHERAIPLYRELREEFEELGMTIDLATVSLDLAEALLTCGRPAEIREVCAASLAYFSKAGLAETESALRALAYLHEAAVAGRVTPTAIRNVRAFLLEPANEARQLFLEPLQ